MPSPLKSSMSRSNLVGGDKTNGRTLTIDANSNERGRL